MATTHLTDREAQDIDLRDLIRRVRAGEEIYIEDGTPARVRLELAPPPTDSSFDSTVQRLKLIEAKRGHPLVMEEDFAADMREIVANRAPGRGDPWDS